MLYSAKYVCLLVLAISSSTFVNAQRFKSLAEVTAAIPACATTCFIKGITSIKCPISPLQSLTDCACPNVPMQAEISICTQDSCVYTDQLAAARVGHSICEGYPIESRQHEVTFAGILAIALPLPFFFLRCYAKHLQTGRLWLDDYAALVAQVSVIVLGGGALASSPLGFGLHYWNVNIDNAEVLYQIYYATQLFYILVQVFAKLSILILFKRLFPGRWFQLATKVMIGFIILHGIAFFFVIVAQCQPIERAWDLFITDYKCVNLSKVVFAGAACSIAEDIIILLMPIPELRKLKVTGRKRFAVAVLLGIGSFACITSIIRIKYIAQFTMIYDQPWDQVGIVIWSIAESIATVICGSILTYRPLFGSLIATVRSTLNTHSRSRLTHDPEKPTQTKFVTTEASDTNASSMQKTNASGKTAFTAGTAFTGTDTISSQPDWPLVTATATTIKPASNRRSIFVNMLSRSPKLPTTLRTGGLSKVGGTGNWQEQSMLDPDWAPVVVGMSPISPVEDSQERKTWCQSPEREGRREEGGSEGRDGREERDEWPLGQAKGWPLGEGERPLSMECV